MTARPPTCPGRRSAACRGPAWAASRARLTHRLQVCDYVGYFVVSPTGMVLASDQDPPIGKALGGYRQEFFNQAMAGQSVVSKPYRSPLLLADESGQLRAELPTM